MAQLSGVWQDLQDPSTQWAIGLTVTVVFSLVAAGWAVYTFRASQRKPQLPEATGRGGDGGDASVGGNGVALGGRGGRPGTLGSGDGGKGGGARVGGDGLAIGGDGGDGGLPWRPALGAPSPLERTGGAFGVTEGLVDHYGIFSVGRGGVGGDSDCEIQFEGRSYKLVPLLHLLRLWAPTAIDSADACMPRSPQEFWERAMEYAPVATRRALQHVRLCEEEVARAGTNPPDPYAIAEELRGAQHRTGLRAGLTKKD